MRAGLTALTPAPAGAQADLQYTPPAGSTLVGGRLAVTLLGDGYGPPSGSPNTVGVAALSEGGLGAGDVFLQCVAWLAVCSPGSSTPVERAP